MKNYRLICHLGSPMVMNHIITLDAVIGGMLFQEGMDGADAAKTIGYFDRWNEVPMASFVILPDEANRTTGRAFGNINQSVNRLRDLAVERGISPTQERNTQINSYILYQIPKVEFLFRGDRSLVEALMRRIGAIGAFTAKGHGMLRQLDFIEQPEDPHFGIVDAGRVLRPVPWHLIDQLSLSSRPVRARGRWANPYNPAVAIKHGYDFESIALPETGTV